MTVGVVGRKCGMTRVFLPGGAAVAVTVVEVMPNVVTQIKTLAKDHYTALQVTTGTCKVSRLNRCQKGHFAKANVEAGRGLWEFRVPEATLEGVALGAVLTVDQFAPKQLLSVTGVTKGKGFAGVVKRHHFHMQDASHGNSLSHRAPGSIGQCQDPGRVFKGKKMAGHMGDARRTVRGLEVMTVDVENNLLLVKGAVPGAPGGNLLIVPLTAAVRASKASEAV